MPPNYLASSLPNHLLNLLSLYSSIITFHMPVLICFIWTDFYLWWNA